MKMSAATKTWFVTRSTADTIDNVKTFTAAETATTVCIEIDTPSGEKITRVRAKRATWEQYHPTFDEARSFLINRQIDRIDRLKTDHTLAIEALHRIKRLGGAR